MLDMPKPYIIIDGNHLVHRIWHTSSGQSLKTRDGTASGIVHGFLASICGLLKTFKPEGVYVVWDHKSRHRRRILRDYREKLDRMARQQADETAEKLLNEAPFQYKETRYKNRTNDDHRQFQEEMLPQMQALQDIIPNMGFRQLVIPEVEGDDLIGIITDLLVNEPDAEVVIVSSDQDLYQLLAPNVSQYDPIKKKSISRDDFKASFALEPHQWVEVKALMGDEHDDIPGVPGIGQKTAVKLIKEHGGVKETIDAARVAPKNAVMTRIPEYAEQIRLAYEMSYILSSPSDLDQDQAEIFNTLWFRTPAIDWDEVQRFIDVYELRKVGPELRALIVDSSVDATLAACTTVDEMFAAWGECTRCGLHETRNKIVRYAGAPRAKVMFLGEAPGPSEDFYGDPFVGKAGKYLDETLLSHVGLKRSTIHAANIVCCFPNENGEMRPPSTAEVRACSPRLRHHIRLVNPRVVVLLGDKALKAIFPDAGKISDEHGVERTHVEWPGITFVPVFHPSYLMKLQQGPQGHSDVIKSLNDWKTIRLMIDRI